MKNLHENALMQEMNVSQMRNINGGVLPAVAAVFWWGATSGAAIGLALLPTIIEKRDETETN